MHDRRRTLSSSATSQQHPPFRTTATVRTMTTAPAPASQPSPSPASKTTTTTTAQVSLQELWPAVKERFSELSDGNGHFPLQYSLTKNKSIRDAMYSNKTSSSRDAAVLLLVCSVGGHPSVLFTVRSSRMPSHASEISFPGGHRDADTDSCLVDTALREAREELLPDKPRTPAASSTYPCDDDDDDGDDGKCLISSNVDVLGQTTWLPSLKGVPVTPVLAALLGEREFDSDDDLRRTFPGNPEEVEVVFTVPIQTLLDTETHHIIPNNRFGIKHAPLYPSDFGNIWGLTAFILRPVLRRLFKPPMTQLLLQQHEQSKDEQEQRDERERAHRYRY